MGLPDDMAESISKNHFRIELFWEISKMIECHKENTVQKDDFKLL